MPRQLNFFFTLLLINCLLEKQGGSAQWAEAGGQISVVTVETDVHGPPLADDFFAGQALALHFLSSRLSRPNTVKPSLRIGIVYFMSAYGAAPDHSVNIVGLSKEWEVRRHQTRSIIQTLANIGLLKVVGGWPLGYRLDPEKAKGILANPRLGKDLLNLPRSDQMSLSGRMQQKARTYVARLFGESVPMNSLRSFPMFSGEKELRARLDNMLRDASEAHKITQKRVVAQINATTMQTIHLSDISRARSREKGRYISLSFLERLVKDAEEAIAQLVSAEAVRHSARDTGMLFEDSELLSGA